ncbi:MAG: glutamine--fructose-6-phosphate transaminase (isomerizing) [Deltaproteobacteria bacterium]|nr:glutamine--fructose-6-phosphate transaminase (isomerizing) [Deltaproteobacteria bacterium]
MCGIVGYSGHEDCVDLLVDGLRRLEYRGYDSAGVAVMGPDGQVSVVRSLGKLSVLAKDLVGKDLKGHVGIGHTRWATHGGPSESNAHPHKVGRVTLVHNGIVENHLELKDELTAKGRRFQSETDTEILAHLIDEKLEEGAEPVAAIRAALAEVRGTWGLAMVIEGVTEAEGRVFCAKNSSPLIVGLGEEASLVASDIPALLVHTRRMIFLEDGDVAALDADGVTIWDGDGHSVERPVRSIDWSPMMAEKEGFKHFMLKEIHEQPRAVSDTLLGRILVEHGDVNLNGLKLDPSELGRVFIVACGTSYHAGLVGKFLIERLARIPVEVDLGSEFRYRDPLIGPGDVMVAISQSGETADTLAAVRTAKEKGATVVAIANVIDSQIPRTSDACIYTHAGPEIGVASTKAFTTQLVALVCLAVYLGRRNGRLSDARGRELLQGLAQIPAQMHRIIERAPELQVLARRYANKSDFLYLGRGINYPIALEGALKLKEISYIHAEGYPAGEMKHGPIALIDENLPVVSLMPSGPGYDKMLNNIEEVRARNGMVLAVATEGDKRVGSLADDLFLIPDVLPELQPLLAVVPLQLLAYYVADYKGTDVDQPRNLAKSVTVE